MFRRNGSRIDIAVIFDKPKPACLVRVFVALFDLGRSFPRILTSKVSLHEQARPRPRTKHSTHSPKQYNVYNNSGADSSEITCTIHSADIYKHKIPSTLRAVSQVAKQEHYESPCPVPQGSFISASPIQNARSHPLSLPSKSAVTGISKQFSCWTEPHHNQDFRPLP